MGPEAFCHLKQRNFALHKLDENEQGNTNVTVDRSHTRMEQDLHRVLVPAWQPEEKQRCGRLGLKILWTVQMVSRPETVPRASHQTAWNEERLVWRRIKAQHATGHQDRRG